ncbi:MAG TPA: helix-turn-helix transcriptional regulator [Candidatus Pacearchaeota archaeon]|jgi:transcriptional regulator with XRE-family HTH domain|nr:helix-turn-helix transcriptional regulator [Candidatus Pacearchaeota archaeon]
MKAMSNKISENLKKLREKKGYSLEKVARLADLSLNTIVKVENGVNKNPTIETLTKIAKALEVGVDDLIK